jgi:hypothetical protein
MNREKTQRIIDRVLRMDVGGNLIVDLSATPELNRDERLEVMDWVNRRHEEICRGQVRRSARIDPNSTPTKGKQ